MDGLKAKAMFAVSVLAVIALVSFAQKKGYKVPVVGDYLPGA